jgi:CheY-like chemotaxis protein
MEDHLQKIGISARYLLSLINDILDMSRIESGKMALRETEFDFREMIDSINTILYTQCSSNSIDYECVVKGYVEKKYVGDSTKLQQILVNILGNSVKFTPHGGKIHFLIEQVSHTEDKARMRFTIADTGIGIDENYLPHIFETFSQENGGSTSVYGGSGLGLAISRNIAKMMDGDIKVHSVKNMGSDFTVEVTLGTAKEEVPFWKDRKRLPNGLMRKMKTLIVDDDVIVCEHTSSLLGEAGIAAEWVTSGAAAVSRVREENEARQDYQLILLDWKMPDMDGIETARQIRKIVGPEVTIIIMTGYDWAEIEKGAVEAGVDSFMRKPVAAAAVIERYNELTEHRHPEEETPAAESFDFTGKNVLLVEDNDINAEIAQALLEMKGLHVDRCRNGVEAIETFTTAEPGRYSAILMDVRMPVMNGLEATRAIRQLHKAEGRTIPIIAMTANAFDEDIRQSLDSGMNAHLAKPIEPENLYATLQHFMDAADAQANMQKE